MKTVYFFLRQRAQVNTLFSAFVLFIIISLLPVQADGQGCVVSCPPMDPPTPISLSQECEDIVTPELIGLVANNCEGPFVVELFNSMGDPLGNVINSDMIGQVLMAVITSENDGGQGCMTSIIVVDKFPPIVSCPDDVTVPCPTPLEDIPPITQDDVQDCTPVTIDYIDVPVFVNDCDGDFVSKFMRTYYVTDENNNVYTCTQMISLAKVPLSSVEWPTDLKGDDALACYPDPDTSPENTGTPTVNGDPIVNGNICNLLVSKDDQYIDLCSGGYKILRTWTVMDWCDNVSTQTVQLIEVRDFTGPEVDVLEYLQESAGPDCDADVLLPPADITEDCGDTWTVRMQGPFGTIQSNGGFVTDIPTGVFNIIYIATNDCGLEGRDTLVLEVIDNSTPTALCNASVVVPVNSSGMAIVPAEGFDGGSLDNCNDVWFKARRMTAPAGYDCFANDNDQYYFDDVVKFCCEDIPAGPIMVIMRVYDIAPVPGIVSDDYLDGHYTDCMITVEVQDKLGPSIVCPSDLTISCEFPFDPDNLSVFGSVVTDPGQREEICIDDPGNPGTSGLECIGLDGLAQDNCNVTIEEEMAMILDSLCGTGQITRTFTATDDGGRSTACVQVITITNYTPFTADDISWPLDFVTTDICEVEALDPEDLPPPYNEPVLTYDQCDLVTFNYSDEVFDFSGTSQACFKILRKWVVLDWCQFDAENPNAGRWEHLQVLKVKNLVAPEFTEFPDDLTVCGSIEDCGPADVVLEASASDDCTFPETLAWKVRVDENNDGSFDQNYVGLTGESVSVPVQLPLGFHRVLYSVQDYCGNSVVNEQYITVESCTPPSAKCQNITTTLMPVDLDGDGQTDWGMVTIWASDLDAGSDHPCGLEVTVAFSDNPSDQSMVFNCDDLGVNEVELWVIDENGLTDFCTVTVEIQDNNLVCPEELPSSGTIAGAISSSASLAMDEIMVTLDGSAIPPAYTQNGSYVFPVMPFGGTYNVKPISNDDPTNGVSTIDLIQIQKHLLGIQTFDTPYKYIAADANKSGSVTAVDILELKKLILGVYEELPNNNSWRFVDAAYQWIDPNNPLAEQFPESYKISPFQTDMNDIDFVGVKVGDINESANVLTGGEGGSNDLSDGNGVSLVIPEEELVQGEITNLMVSAENLDALATIQFTLNWNENLIEVLDVIPGPRARKDQWNKALLEEGMLPSACKIQRKYRRSPVAWFTSYAWGGTYCQWSCDRAATEI